MTESAYQLSPGYNFAGRYYISRCIGTGGMGAVYEATHAETRGRCALKVMLPRIVHREDMRKRFLQEAQVTAQINSDHIVRIFDAGVDDVTAMPFIVMELLEGEDLDALMQRSKIVQPTAVVNMLRQAALALDKTHAAGVVHRDLKPHNIFVTRRDDGSPCVKILDFGIAKLIDASGGSQRTRSAGTPLYMPPEQIRGEGDIAAAADIYALSHIAYALLTGTPYWEKEAQELGLGPFIERVFSGPVEPPTVRAARAGVTLPPSFDAWFARAASADRNARFSPASAAIDQLAIALGITDTGSGIFLPPPVTPAQMSTAAGLPQVGPATPFTPAPAPTFPSTTGGAISAPAQPARSSTKPIWFVIGAFVVLGSVGAGSLLTWRLLAKERRRDRVEETDDEEDRDSNKKKKKKLRETGPCPFEICRDYGELDLEKPIEALDHLGAADKLAHTMEAEAKLTLINITDLVGGVPPPDSVTTIIYTYRYPKPGGQPGEYSAVQVFVNSELIMGRHLVGTGQLEVPPPTCRTQDALRAAFADGLDKGERVAVMYGQASPSTKPRWLLTTATGSALRMVDGATCKSTSTEVITP